MVSAINGSASAIMDMINQNDLMDQIIAQQQIADQISGDQNAAAANIQTQATN